MKKKPIGAICIVSVMSILLTGCCLSHDWQEATCTTPKTCAKCGETEGEALGHDWQEATCTEAKTCSVCGKTKGEALGHNWQEATCTEPKTCSICGITEGEAGHTWREVTCQAPKTCSVCGKTEGEPIQHIFNGEGTCTICHLKRITLTWENVGEYLKMTYSLSSNGLNNRITVTVAPASNNYSFQDVQIHIGMNLSKSNGELFLDAPLDFNSGNREQLYDVDNEGNLTIEGYFPQDYKLDAYRGVQIYDVRGYCIK